MNVLIIPDAHAHPKTDNKRFDWLGKFISDVDPDLVVCLGDFADMAALSSYDRGKLSFEGRRYKDDLKATHNAQERLFDKAHKASSEYVMLLGNHEDRIDRAVNENPELEGHICMEDLQYEDYWDTVVPFLAPYHFRGYFAAHYFPAGIMGRPVGGKHIAASLLNKTHCSTIVGHNHLFAAHCENRPNGEKMWGFSAGCYTHPGLVEKWCSSTMHMWDRGVLFLQGVDKGTQDAFTWITQEELRRRAK